MQITKVDTAKVLYKNTLSTIISILLRLITRILIVSWLGIIGVAFMITVDLIASYVSYFDLGIHRTVSRQLPIEIGQGNISEEKALISHSISWNIFMSLMTIIIFSSIYKLGLDFGVLYNTRITILFLIMLVFLRNERSLRNVVKGLGLFGEIANLRFFRSFSTPIIVLFFIYFFWVEGYLMSMIMVSLIGNVYFLYHILSLGKYHFGFNIAYFLKLLKLSSFLWLIYTFESIFLIINPTFISLYLNSKDLAIFGFCLGIFTLISAMFGTIAPILERNLLLRAEISEKKTDSEYIFTKGLYLHLFLITFLYGNSYFLYKFMVVNFLPEFTASIHIFLILIGGHIAFSLYVYLRSILSSMDRMKQRLWFALVAIIVNLALDYYIIDMGYSIIEIAYAFSFTLVLYTFICYSYCQSIIFDSYRSSIQNFLHILVQISVCVYLLHLMDTYILIENQTFYWLILETIIKIVFYSIAVYIFCVTYYRTYSLNDLLLEYWGVLKQATKMGAN